MLGPEGVGLGYASSRALDRIDQSLEGWFSVRDPFDFFDLEQPLRDTAARYEDGAYNVAGLHGMVGSLELLLGVGVVNISRRILELTDHLAQGLQRKEWLVHSPRDVEHERSGIVLTGREGIDVPALRQRLAERKVVVSVRGGALRIAPHAYNTVEEIDTLLEIL